jgi:hypothetical protein
VRRTRGGQSEGTGHASGRGRLATVLFALVCAVGILLAQVPTVSAKVFAGQKDALAAAFPSATRIERDTLILVKEQVAAIEAITKKAPPTRIIVLHTAWENETLLGYAHIDVHNVRTQPEAFMIVLTPAGVVRSVRILAFHEPLDYLPTDRWYGQFEGKTRADRLRVGGDVHGVVGATLSARAAAEGVRRMLAYWEVLLRPETAEVEAEAP